MSSSAQSPLQRRNAALVLLCDETAAVGVEMRKALNAAAAHIREALRDGGGDA